MRAKITLLLLAILTAHTASRAALDDRRERWEQSLAKLEGVDTIVVQQNLFTRIPIWNFPKRLIHKRSRYYKRFKEELSPEDAHLLIALLQYDESSKAAGAHGCRGLFQVEFLRDGEMEFGLGYAHGKFSAPISKEAETAILEYLDSRGFPTKGWVEAERAMEAAIMAEGPK